MPDEASIDALRSLHGRRLIEALETIESATFATLIATASREQLDAAFATPALRNVLLAEAFGRMAHHVRADRVGRLRAVVRWRLTKGGGAGGYDRYECHFADGGCTVHTGTTDGTPARRSPSRRLIFCDSPHGRRPRLCYSSREN